jgi:hypothetical protein
MYRVRTLYDAYAADLAHPRRPPLRGVAPHQVSFFWRSAQLKCEAAVLAGFLRCYEVLSEVTEDEPRPRFESIPRGEQLCRAYEAFRAFWPEAQATLEHAILLLTELRRAVEISTARCIGCDVLIVIDRLSIAPPRCAWCAHERHAGLPYLASEKAPESPRPLLAAHQAVQGELF